jgi:hypothetical protein
MAPRDEGRNTDTHNPFVFERARSDDDLTSCGFRVAYAPLFCSAISRAGRSRNTHTSNKIELHV